MTESASLELIMMGWLERLNTPMAQPVLGKRLWPKLYLAPLTPSQANLSH